MTLPFTLRPFEPEDGPAFARLLLDSPDTGRIHITLHYQVDPYAALSVRQGDFLGVVAETPGQEGLIGAGLVRFRQAQIEGELRPSALLNTLIVHPRFRRHGIATALVEWQVRAARQRFGDEGVIWASIQRGNVGSVRTVTKFLPQMIPDRLTTIPMKMRNKPPKPVPGWHVREASEDELAQVTHHLNAFYEDYNLYEPQTGETMARWLADSPLETPFRHYLVLTDAAGEVLAGAAVVEAHRLSVLHVTDMSPSLRFLNALLKFVPADGASKSMSINRYWHKPGQLHALRHLVETIRWQWRDQANMVTASVDVASPLIRAFPLRPWTPAPRMSVVAAGPVSLSHERLIA